MAKHTPEQYLAAMEATDGQPLLHTVFFESRSGSSEQIQQIQPLLEAVRGLITIKGVDSVRYAVASPSRTQALEELTLRDSTALQDLRTDPVHKRVVDVAAEHTNWTVVDRLFNQAAYEAEPDAIRSAMGDGNYPFLLQHIAVLGEDATETDEASAVTTLENSFPGTGVLSTPEASLSLDRRKGPVAIARIAFESLAELQGYSARIPAIDGSNRTSTVAHSAMMLAI